MRSQLCSLSPSDVKRLASRYAHHIPNADALGSNAFFPGNRTAQSFAWLAGPELAQPLVAAYTNFAADEPNNAGAGESCVTFYSNANDRLGKWYDVSCISTYSFVIEYEAFTASWPSATTHVPTAGGSAYQLLETPAASATAVALAPPAPLRMTPSPRNFALQRPRPNETIEPH